jgi:hypothetical protein
MKFWVEVTIKTTGRFQIDADSLEAAQDAADDLTQVNVDDLDPNSVEQEDAEIESVYEVKDAKRTKASRFTP